MKTVFSNQVTGIIPRKQSGEFVLKTSKDVVFEFSETFPRSAAIIGMIDNTICSKLSDYSCDEVEFSFSLSLKTI